MPATRAESSEPPAVTSRGARGRSARPGGSTTPARIARRGARGSSTSSAQRMRLLPVVDAVVLDRTVGAPVRHGRERVLRSAARRRPVLEHDGRKGRDPVAAAASGRNSPGRPTSSPTVTKCVCAVEAHVDRLDGMPELVEGRVEIEVDANRNRLEKTRSRRAFRRRSASTSASPAPLDQALVREPDRGSRCSQRGARRGRRARTRHTRPGSSVTRSAVDRLDRLDEYDVVAEPPQPERRTGGQPRSHRPEPGRRRAPRRRGSRRRSRHRASSSSRVSTTSESSTRWRERVRRGSAVRSRPRSSARRRRHRRARGMSEALLPWARCGSRCLGRAPGDRRRGSARYGR